MRRGGAIATMVLILRRISRLHLAACVSVTTARVGHVRCGSWARRRRQRGEGCEHSRPEPALSALLTCWIRYALLPEAAFTVVVVLLLRPGLPHSQTLARVCGAWLGRTACPAAAYVRADSTDPVGSQRLWMLGDEELSDVRLCMCAEDAC